MSSELVQILQEAQRLEEQVDQYHPGRLSPEEADFRRLFFATDPEKEIAALKKQLERCSAALEKFAFEKDYAALQREKARMTSASVQIALLMQHLKAKRADVLTARLHTDAAKDYAQSVQRLSTQAVDAEAFRERFVLQKKGSAVEIGKVEVDSIIKFGHYPQTESGKDNTPIEWQVLETDGKTALCIAKYGLDCKQFHHELTSITWEKCDLRKWLNSDFLKKAFTTAEQENIVQSAVHADTNPSYKSTPQGNDTRDKVFLLSILEAQKYFGSDSARATKPTAYAVKHGAYKGDNGNCWWWLRSSGFSSYGAAYVHTDGSIHSHGGDVYYRDDSVRPVVVLRLF